MNNATELSSNLPLFYIVGVLLTSILAIEAFTKTKKQVWSIPALAVYATVGIWYFVELIYTPENFKTFDGEIIEHSFFQVIIFLISFRICLAFTYKIFIKNAKVTASNLSFKPEKLLQYISIIWLCLLLYGISRLNGDVIGALFPINARAGVNMWQRAAGSDAGSTGFLVSSAGYIYLLVCSFFCILLPLQTKNSARLFNLLLILISLPYFALQGARNQLLAVILPGYFSYAIFSKNKWWVKLLLTVVTFLVINYVLTIIIEYRNIGLAAFFEQGAQVNNTGTEEKHKGLNMLEELCYINRFNQEGTLQITYGMDYLAEMANVIPRGIWPEKPLIGIEYAKLRGFGGGTSDIGVTVTIATGLIGQGVVNFGADIGPVAPGFLMALWASFLSRLWLQRYSVLRLCLFLAGVGTTFNLGRNFTLLVLWPIVFGYVLVRFLEKRGRKRNLSWRYRSSL